MGIETRDVCQCATPVASKLRGGPCQACRKPLPVAPWVRSERARARAIVKLAAKQTEVTYLREWFTRDERGHWEKCVLDLLTGADERAKALGMSEAEVDLETARYVAFLGATAMLNRRKGRS